METADVADADAFRTALEAADFESVRGKFSFAPNHHPVQDLYVREVIEEEGVYTNRLVGTAVADHTDPYGADCER